MMELTHNWRVQRTDPGQYDCPEQVKTASSPELGPVSAPITVASLMADSHPIEELTDLDGSDWWYSTEFDLDDAAARHTLVFDGLATLCEIWLNDEKILQTDNMFRGYRADVTGKLGPHNQLVLCFRSVKQALEGFKKRPRWKTKLVEHQQLRWVRTSLLGYIPGWTPPAKPIGIWRGVRLESASAVCLNDFSLQTTFVNSIGVLHLKADISNLTEEPCEILLELNGETHTLFTGSAAIIQLDKELHLPDVGAWMPHTHGEATLYPYRFIFKSGDQLHVMKEARVGFRNVTLDQQDGRFQFQVNGRSIFARGAVWTINDILSLNGKTDDLSQALLLARDAGMNMLRVGGTMVYEQDEFYHLCDNLGIMIWQDFMFANMDYPVGDEAFRVNINAEASYQLKRLSAHPSVVAYCGNSEVEQQAAMLGIPAEMWRNDWFASELPELVKSLHADSVYVPSSPFGGTLPFYTREGVAHYYGVGAYLRDITDVRRADVKFTSECLGFANMPEAKTLEKFKDGSAPVTQHPLWKRGVPHDTGTDWDFEDVRDHYLSSLFGEDPLTLRNMDEARYLSLSRIASGEMMSQVFSEWRSSYSHCGGGLVWFYKDLLPGAGWGVIDSSNHPKAAYYFLKRVFQPVCVLITDEGLQGLHLHIINENSEPFTGTVEFSLLRDGNVPVAKARRDVTLNSGQTQSIQAEDLLGGFYDTAYAYRFGAPAYQVACAALTDKSGRLISQQFHFPLKHHFPPIASNLTTNLTAQADGTYNLEILSDHFLYAVHIECEGWLPDDTYFHLMPNANKYITLKPVNAASKAPQVVIHALNLPEIIQPRMDPR